MSSPINRTLRLPVIVLGLCLGSACAPLQAQSTPIVPGQLRNTLGVVTKFRQGEPIGDLVLLKDLGVTWVRDTIYWPDIEPTANKFVDFTPATLERLNYYKANNIGVIMLLLSGNPAYGDPKLSPASYYDPVAFGRYGAVMTQRLKALGLRFVIEVYNEPHNTLSPAFGGQWNGRPPSPWLDHYLRMVRETVAQIRAIDSTVKVISDDDMWVVHYWFLEGGLPLDLNGFAIHPYAPRGPERAAVDYNTDWVYPYQAVDIDASFRSGVRRLKEQGMIKMGRTPEIYTTELGWPIGGASPYGVVTEDILSALLPRSFIVSHASGVEALTWFSLQDNVDGPMGLTANNGYKRLSYVAFKTLSTQLGDSKLVRQVAGQTHLTSGVQAFLYQPTGSTTNKLAIWTVGGEARTLTFPKRWSKVTVVNQLGKAVTPSSDKQGNRSISVGLAPMYLAGIVDDADLASALAPLQ